MVAQGGGADAGRATTAAPGGRGMDGRGEVGATISGGEGTTEVTTRAGMARQLRVEASREEVPAAGRRKEVVGWPLPPRNHVVTSKLVDARVVRPVASHTKGSHSILKTLTREGREPWR